MLKKLKKITLDESPNRKQNKAQPSNPNTLIANSKKDELQRSRGGENGMKTPVEDNSENLSIQLGARNAQFESGLDQEDSGLPCRIRRHYNGRERNSILGSCSSLFCQLKW
ncbi:uncharacterized protein LOC113289166 isoform X2 [Papaver somniferum]|uniref:uncharacterized protein LOC113289166 isoform X2 n=1 Tax=Papaver somniferum TaxID=3469 RepID=UPI000E6F9B80|nr:uncharacterized protein LOC113289166 isoform X2 [Papaver somniferum]